MYFCGEMIPECSSTEKIFFKTTSNYISNNLAQLLTFQCLARKVVITTHYILLQTKPRLTCKLIRNQATFKFQN